MKLTPADLDRIEALARKAGDEWGYEWRLHDGYKRTHLRSADGRWIAEYLAEIADKHIAAADPATVLELCRLARRTLEQETT